MNISPISSASNTYLSSSTNGEIKMLEKQKEQLQKQIQITKESKMDSKTKQETIKQLQDQIRQIETQIQQKRNEKLTEGSNPRVSEPTKNRSQSSNAEIGDGSLSGMSDLLQANSSLSRVKLMNGTKESLNGKNGILEQEIKLDEGRGLDPKAKKAELSDNKSRIQSLEKDMGTELGNSKEKVKDASESADGNKTSDSDEIKEKSDKEQAESMNQKAEDKENEAGQAAENSEEYEIPAWMKVSNINYKKVDTLI